MKTDFINLYAHWLLLLIVGLSIMMRFTIFTSSVQRTIADRFGIGGFWGITYLVFHLEVQKRKKGK
jgi:hypothetical protein